MKAPAWLLTALAFVFTAGVARAADTPGTGQHGPFVVVVGVGQFRDKAIDPRPTSDADARAVYDLFTDPKYLGVPPERARLLLSAPEASRNAEAATRDAIVKAVEAAASRTGKDDLIVLAFFGRGATAGEKTVFFTPDSTFKDRANDALLPATQLAAAFKKLDGQKVLLLMDVHYKGFHPEKETEKVAEPTLTDVDQLLFGSEEKEEAVRKHNRLMLLGGYISSDPLTRGDMGLFASTLIDGLRGAADDPPQHEGYEPDGVVTTTELIKYLDREISNHARKIGKTDKERESQAVPIGGATSKFAVTRNPAQTAGVQKRLDALARLAKAGAVSEELAQEGAALLSRMPRLKASQELRKNYQKLADGAMNPAEFVAARTAIKDGMKLDPKVADNYALTLTDATEYIAKLYIKQLDLGEMTASAIKGMYQRSDEPLPADLADALKDPKGMSEERRMELLRGARLRLGRREDLDDNKDVDASLLMMLAALNDPYTVYYDKEMVRKMASALRGRFPGVGVQIRRDVVHDALLVVSPIKGSPAFAAGIQAGDLITEIRREVDSEGKPLPEGSQRVFSTKGMKTDEAISIITGKPGSPVTLVIDRDGREQTFSLKRNWVNVETVLGLRRNSDAEWDHLLDANHRIGYVRLTQFTQNTASELRTVIGDLKKTGLNGLVLDLRGNPGGYLTAATGISEFLVGQEKLVTVRPREGGGTGRPRIYRGGITGDKSFEIVVLVNGTSASASEIVAACLQDYGRATIVGERSYGKGSVQDVVKFDETGGEIKLTIARYYPPSERNIDKMATKGLPEDEWGVHPDKGFEVKLTAEERTALETLLRDIEVIPAPGTAPSQLTPEKDRQLAAALTHLRKVIDANNKKGSDK